MYRNDLTCEFVRRLFTHDAERGVLIWNHRPVSDFRDKKTKSAAMISYGWNERNVGKVAGYMDALGYRNIVIDGLRYLAHRLIWLHVTGKWPVEQIDHIAGTEAGDVMSNLREATNAENGRNKKLQAGNTVGCSGVIWHKHINKWRVRIKAREKLINIGEFPEKSHAIAARKVTEAFYGFHPNHGTRR